MLIYSEAAFFDGHHVQHIADREEHLRRERIAKVSRDVVRMAERERR